MKIKQEYVFIFLFYILPYTTSLYTTFSIDFSANLLNIQVSSS